MCDEEQGTWGKLDVMPKGYEKQSPKISDKCRQIWHDYQNKVITYRQFVEKMAELVNVQKEIKF